MMRQAIFTAIVLGLLASPPGLARAGATASSELQDSWGESGKTNANSAVDGDPSTAWIEGAESDGVGEWIEVDLPRGTLLAFEITGGMGPDADAYERYSRPKDIEIDIYSLDDAQNPQAIKQVTHTFEDKYGPATIDVGELGIGGELWGGKAKLTIRSTYPGTDFDSLVAIAEIRSVFKEQPCPTQAIEVSSNADKKDLLVDEKTSTTWVAAGGAEEWFTVEAPDWSIASVGIYVGSGSHSKPKTIELKCMMETITLELEDTKDWQWFALPSFGGYNGSAYGEVRMQVKELYPGGSGQVGIGEVQLRAINYGS